ncbi:hypothetical protein BB406_04025 [Helicobacter pylori]|uniref:Uncharacterized protein n=1 Tax=Helicobacter pylori TaxID=210 RepID=A0AAE5NY74_HELPX|nr:hypothetical protein BB406_04025 [Helicobacter pylori]
MSLSSLFLLNKIKITPSIKSKKKKELKFLKKPQFVAELIQKNKRALRKASSNLLKMRSLGGFS